MDDLLRLQALTANYDRMRSLRLAPVFVFFIVSPWTMVRGGTAGYIWIGFALFAVLWYWLFDRYYRVHFGRVEPGPQMGENKSGLLVAGVVFLLIAVYWALLLRRGHTGVGILLLSALLLIQSVFTRPNVGLRRFCYVGGAILLILVALPVLISGLPGIRFVKTYALTVVGAVWLAVGIFDHLLLQRMFRPEAKESHV
jgi:hypothetical protein